MTLRLETDFGRAPLVARTVYTKIDHPNFLELYTSSFAQTVTEQLNAVVARHLAKLLRLRTSGTEQQPLSLPNIAQNAVDEALRSSPERVLELVEQDMLPVGGLTHALDSDIEDSSSDLSRDFARAYTKLRETAWSKAALRWFEGDLLTLEERDDLGLHSLQIAKPDQARKATRFLLEAHRKADVPILLCIDEFERFSVRGSEDDQRASPSFLKDLAEMFESTGNAFILCGAQDAWTQLPGDTFDRIRRERIIEVSLTNSEAEGLLSVYCKNSGQSLLDVFDRGTLSFLIDLSERNARRMLNISYEAFDLAQGQRRISQQDVRQAAAKALADDQRFQSMDEALVRVAREHMLGVARQFSVGGVVVDYALGASGERPIFLIVTRSSYKTDEVGASRSAAAVISEVKKGRPQARAGIIVVGYSTAEVREQLERVSDAVLVYDEDRFAAELADFVRTAPITGSNADVYNQALQRFAEIEGKRTDDFNRLAKQLEAMQAALMSQTQKEEERRVTDKFGASVTDLQELLKQEQNLVEEGLRNSQPGNPLLNQAKVIAALDSERVLVRRLQVLNDGLPEGNSIRSTLSLILYQLDRWEAKLHGQLDADSLRAEYRGRRESLHDLELLHLRRRGREFNLLGWRVSSRYLAISVIAAIGIIFAIAIFISGIVSNRRILDTYYARVVEARSTLSQIYSSPQAQGSLTADVAKVRGEIDRSFFTARSEDLAISVLGPANQDLINALDKESQERYDPQRYAFDGIKAADQLFALRPSVLWVTLKQMWPWLVIGLIPAVVALIWQLVDRLRNL
jgi:hypothetical protein